MTNRSRIVALLAAIAAVTLLAAPAQAQLYGAAYGHQPAPLYPYAVQTDQPYAVQVAPGTYEIHRPAASRANPYLRARRADNPAPERSEPRFDRPHKPANRALIEELRKRHQSKRDVINTTKIVRDPAVVVETKRYVDDPPRVIERQHVVEDQPRRDGNTRPGRDDNKKRVIQADAEITIIGPDRMSIRLFRKGHNARSN
jgi:hypothetical protein